ncbi:MAG: serine/threonine-protein phosphatase, partial [Thermoguttaceae bacterium]|nr:serine/threonine-protein phosphatase [Thermoguttaceae bacterium]
GDSRVYRARNRRVEQLTFDHSLVWEVRRLRNVPPELRQRTPNIPKNIITRSLGPVENLTVDVEGPFPLRPGDVFLLCSDGLTGRVSDAELGQILEVLQPDDAVEFLVNLANLRGGPDNITAVVAKYKGAPTGDDVEKAISKSAKLARRMEKTPPNPASKRYSILAGCSLGAVPILGGLVYGVCGAILPAVLAAFLALGASALFAWLAAAARLPEPPSEEEPSKSGAAPYSRASTEPTPEFCEAVAKLRRELVEAVENNRMFRADWKGVESATTQAETAKHSADYAAALRAYASVVNYFMRELRKK